MEKRYIMYIYNEEEVYNVHVQWNTMYMYNGVEIYNVHVQYMYNG